MEPNGGSLICPKCASDNVKKKIGWWILLVAVSAYVAYGYFTNISSTDTTLVMVDGMLAILVVVAFFIPIIDRHACKKCGNRWK